MDVEVKVEMPEGISIGDVFVKVQNDGKQVTYMLIDENGMYTLKNLNGATNYTSRNNLSAIRNIVESEKLKHYPKSQYKLQLVKR